MARPSSYECIHDDRTPDISADTEATQYPLHYEPRVSNQAPPEDLSGEREHNRCTSESPPATAIPGERKTFRQRRFGDFELLEELGRGGMGVVYKARQVSLNRLVALKTILAGHFASPEAAQRFMQEAQATAALEHPHLVPIYETGELEDQPFFTMPLLNGGSLQQLLSQGPLPPLVAAHLMQQVAEGVQYAHERGIIHRDIKPQNILLQWDEVGDDGGWDSSAIGSNRADGFRRGTPTPRLTDFGLARLALDGSGMTVTGEALGTPSYMPPEQAAGHLKQIGVRSDVYGLGAVLYSLLVGRPPFQSASPAETLRQVREEQAVMPRQLNPGIARDLETVCMKCLSKEPERRYGSAGELAADLGRFLVGAPVHARPVRAWERCYRWCRRNLVVTVLATGLIFLALVGGGLVIYQWRTALTALDRADREQRQRREAQVLALRDASPGAVPSILASLEEHRPELLPRLRELWQEEQEPLKRMRLALALLPAEPETVRAPLLEFMLRAAEPAEVLLVRDALTPHAADLAEVLWKKAEAARPPSERFRAAVALAAFDPDSSRWPAAGQQVVEQLLSADPLHLGLWTNALRPVRGALIEPLARVYREKNQGDRRAVAASVLADYASDRPEVLTDLLLDGDPRQYVTLMSRLQARDEKAVALFQRELDKQAKWDWSEADKVVLARRQAQAAVALVQMNKPEYVWPLMRHRPDPTARSYLIHLLGRLGTDPRAVFARFEDEKDVSAQRALLLALGEFDPAVLPPTEKNALAKRLLTRYRDDPDPGIHSAIDWLLRQRWGRGMELQDMDSHLAGQPAEQRRWYVNKQGQTFAVFPGPVEFLMGSPAAEPSHFDSEVLHMQHIPRTFALATRKVSVEQFQRFLKAHPEVGHRYTKRYSPEPDGPIISVTWFEAAQYCRWLSEQEGVAEEDMCYPPIDQIKEGMQLPEGYLQRTGYRLPTEAEWEYACRANATTSRYYGGGEELLGHYAWYLRNSNERSWPLGTLKPNDAGLFDSLGNTWDWTHNRYLTYRVGPAGKPANDIEDLKPVLDEDTRVLRGGTFYHPTSYVRGAFRYNDRSSSRYLAVGLRVARTCR